MEELINSDGKDLKLWFDEVIIPHLERDVNGDPIMPNPEPDIEYWAQLHSWYKHFHGQAVKVYPFLRLGKEPRNDLIDADDTNDLDGNRLHWGFAIEFNIDDSWLPYYAKKNLPWGLMYNHHVHLSSEFSSVSSDLYKFHKMALLKEANEIWSKIVQMSKKDYTW